ncbi:MAG: 5'-methylthioadenosine phosphorylase [Rhodothermaceae bacterium]|nr:MAG: 5'-methylthioadenosine phosphorylase [Rhodothermaceae bacterium]
MSADLSVAVILGSAFGAGRLGDLSLRPVDVGTPWGRQTLHRVDHVERPAYVLFRHGTPHRLLPNQINYRAQAAALRAVDCGALVVTSSVGVLDPTLPLFRLLLVGDLLMPENRLPDGSTCTMFPTPSPEHGHLVLSEGLFSPALGSQLRRLAEDTGEAIHPDAVVFAYAGGPRTKTPAENRLWARLGAQVNSMTLGPEVVLANELGIPCAGLVAGHKYSVPDVPNLEDAGSVEASLAAARQAMERVVTTFLRHGEPVPFGNHLYRFGAP